MGAILLPVGEGSQKYGKVDYPKVHIRTECTGVHSWFPIDTHI